MLSRNCDGCSQIKACGKRYRRVQVNEKVYCPDGTAHLVDKSSKQHNLELQIANSEQICQ